MQITTSPAPKSTVVVEVEVPAERLTTAVGEATRALSRRTRVPGFRPGKAPRVVLEAVLGRGAVLDEAVRRGFAAETVDAGFEWVGFHGTGLAELRALSEPSMTEYAVKFPSFRQCAVASSSPLDFPWFTWVLTRDNAYRLLLIAGPEEPMYLYRVSGPGCPPGD